MHHAIVFARNTTLIASGSKTMQAMLDEVNFQSERYGLNHNKQKLSKVFDGTEMTQATLAANTNIKTEIVTSINKAHNIWQRLWIVFSSARPIRKNRVYRSIMKSTALYGLQGIRATRVHLDSVQASH